MKTIRHVATAADAGRLDVLVARLTGLSRERVRGLVDHGGVVVGGFPGTNAGAAVADGDIVELHFDPHRRYKSKPRERPTQGFVVVFSDEHLVVVDKEAGILTVPTPRGERATLVDRLAMHLGRGKRARVSVVHRLDRETSGLLVFGRTPGVAANLIAQFAAHKPEREYIALVKGKPPKDDDTIISRLATDKALNQRSVSGQGREGKGELAVTHYRVEKSLADSSWVVVRLETGRRNQIRVHFAELGNPVLGDTRYERETARHPAWPYDRLALHARVLGFTHPVTKKTLRFEAPLPREFKEFQRRAKP